MSNRKSLVYCELYTCLVVSFKGSAQRRMWPRMPVKTTAEAISGAAAVFPLVGPCRAEELTVTPSGHLPEASELLSPSNRVVFNPTSGTNTIPGGYMTSFYKKDGSSSHRRHQGPSMESIASSEWFTWHLMSLFNGFSKLIFTYSGFHLCFRLCNVAVWSEPGQLFCQQEFPRSAASSSSTDCPRENRLVCQIRPPLVCLCGAPLTCSRKDGRTAGEICAPKNTVVSKEYF